MVASLASRLPSGKGPEPLSTLDDRKVILAKFWRRGPVPRLRSMVFDTDATRPAEGAANQNHSLKEPVMSIRTKLAFAAVAASVSALAAPAFAADAPVFGLHGEIVRSASAAAPVRADGQAPVFAAKATTFGSYGELPVFADAGTVSRQQVRADASAPAARAQGPAFGLYGEIDATSRGRAIGNRQLRAEGRSEAPTGRL